MMNREEWVKGERWVKGEEWVKGEGWGYLGDRSNGIVVVTSGSHGHRC
jgi:hypothetical protein